LSRDKEHHLLSYISSSDLKQHVISFQIAWCGCSFMHHHPFNSRSKYPSCEYVYKYYKVT